MHHRCAGALARALAVLATFPVLAALQLPAAAAEITAVPPATYVPRVEQKALVGTRADIPLPATAARTIRLAMPTDREMATLKARNGSNRVQTKRSLAIGLGRAVPDAERTIRGSALAWTPATDGGVSARVDVGSTGAAGVRVAIAMQSTGPGVTLRFAGPNAVFGPYDANAIARQASAEGVFWSPVVEGDTVSIELHAPSAAAANGIAFDVVRISHLAVAGQGLRRIDPKLVSDIGLADSCEIDIACIANPSQALLNTAKSVAKMLYTEDDGSSFECTGTMLNDAIASFTPYLFTAAHCMVTQTAASTLNTFWFFDAVSCNSVAVPPYVVLTHGATLLGRSEDYDWALVQLRDEPPARAQFSAWRAEPVDTGVTAETIHHPEGDLKKWSQGVTQGYRTFSDGSTFVKMRWTQGSTEPGSSGAGLFTLSPGAAFYELRGGLFGGAAACSNPAGIDSFSRLDQALPVLREYLTPGVPNPNGEVVVVEFYNATLKHYFMSTNPVEINALDTGMFIGWVRTGERFLAYGDPAQAPAGATPVCRFYLNPIVGDSHFYSGDPNECAATEARFGASWTYESPSVFWTVLPDRTSGVCPAAMRPVYRFFNATTTNHRYTAEVDIRDELATTSGWIAEGYGPNNVIMCSPLN